MIHSNPTFTFFLCFIILIFDSSTIFFLLYFLYITMNNFQFYFIIFLLLFTFVGLLKHFIIIKLIIFWVLLIKIKLIVLIICRNFRLAIIWWEKALRSIWTQYLHIEFALLIGVLVIITDCRGVEMILNLRTTVIILAKLLLVLLLISLSLLECHWL